MKMLTKRSGRKHVNGLPVRVLQHKIGGTVGMQLIHALPIIQHLVPTQDAVSVNAKQARSSGYGACIQSTLRLQELT